MPKVIASVKALLQHQDKFLFLKEESHKDVIWDLPGGKIEYGEDPKETLVREVKEEIFVDIEVGKSIGLWWFVSSNSKHQVICNTFLCEPKGEVSSQPPKLDFTKNPANENFTAFKWLTAKQALSDKEVTLAPSLRQLLSNL